jgi:multidrug efflux pump subunit AcrA (membrane-fusion protein)
VELEPRPAVIVPSSAVRRVGQLATVRVSQDGKWVRRFVTLGTSRDERVEVLSGLRRGEVIGVD